MRHEVAASSAELGVGVGEQSIKDDDGEGARGSTDRFAEGAGGGIGMESSVGGHGGEEREIDGDADEGCIATRPDGKLMGKAEKNGNSEGTELVDTLKEGGKNIN